MPEWVDRCQKALMADPDFKPQEGRTKEESAWAVCQARYKERMQASTITLELVTEPTTFMVASEESGEVLRFRNAILVVAETNSNQDTILEEELQNLAATLPGRPIDDDHKSQRCVGVFTEAAVHFVEKIQQWGLKVGGLIWADRFPEAADGVKTGRLKLSIEADAQSAECSVCNGTFSRALEYCEHLLDKARHGANRILHGLRAVGGGLTPRPAGTGTDFDPDLVYFVAHHNLDGDDDMEIITIMDELNYEQIMAKKLSYQERKKLAKSAFALVQKKDGKEIRRFPIHDCSHARNALARLPQAKDLSSSERATVKRKAEAAVKRLCPKPKRPRTEGGSEMDKTVEQLQAELQEMTRQYDEQFAMRERVEASLAEIQGQVEALTAKVEELTGQLDTANQEKAQVVTAHRKEVLVMKGMSEDDLKEKDEVIGSMSDDQFELLIAHVKPAQTPPPGASGGFSPGGGDGGGGDKVLTL